MKKITASDIIIEYQTDDHFIPAEEKAYFGGVQEKNGIKSQLTSYIDGYREAANAIFDRFKSEAGKGHHWVQDTIVFPLIFNHRHCVELELKRLFCLTDKKFDELSLNKIHKLGDLWNAIKDFFLLRATRLGKSFEIEAINHYISTLDLYDKDSFRFRYPMDVKLSSTNKSLEEINVVTFHRQMNLFHDAMDDIYFSISDQVDDWELNKDFKRNFLYCLRHNLEEVKNALKYEYQKLEYPDKPWLSISEIPTPSDSEIEREYCYCSRLSSDVKELLLILYYSLDKFKLNNITPQDSHERLDDILKVCNDTFNNQNIFDSTSIETIFRNKFYHMVSIKEQIICLAEEIDSLNPKK